jgi:hypothetical protein
MWPANIFFSLVLALIPKGCSSLLYGLNEKFPASSSECFNTDLSHSVWLVQEIYKNDKTMTHNRKTQKGMPFLQNTQ